MTDFLQYPGALQALVVCLSLGSLLAFLGIPLVIKRKAFTGVALSQVAGLAGVLGSLLLLPDFILPLLLSFFLVLWLEFSSSRRSAQDGILAIIFISAAGISTLIVSIMPGGEADLLSHNFGNLQIIQDQQMWVALIFSVVSAAILLLMWRPLLAVMSDPFSAQVNGISVPAIRIIFSLILAGAITLGLFYFGVMLVFAFLIGPAMLALRITQTKWGWIIGSALIIVLLSTSGLWISFTVLDTAPGIFLSALLGIAGLGGWIIRT